MSDLGYDHVTKGQIASALTEVQAKCGGLRERVRKLEAEVLESDEAVVTMTAKCIKLEHKLRDVRRGVEAELHRCGSNPQDLKRVLACFDACDVTEES